MFTLATANTIQGNCGTATAVTYTIFGMELASGTETYKVLAQGQIPASVGALYTVPGSTTAFVKHICLANATASPVTGITLLVNGTAAANQIIPAITLLANGSASLNEFGLQVYDGLGNLSTSGTNIFDATAPAVTTPLAIPVVGSAVVAARRDHTHQSPGGIYSSVAASSGINTSETSIAGATIPANFCQAGTSFRITAFGICTSSAANLSTFTVRMGTANANTDASITVVTCTAATSGTAVGFQVEFIVNVRSAGASVTAAGGGYVINQGITGISSTGVGGVAASGTISGTVNTTVLNYLTLWYKSAVSTTTSTFQATSIEVVKM